MKLLLVFSLAILFSFNCTPPSPTVHKNNMTLNDSTYSNGQLAYTIEEDIIRFYDYKGMLIRQMNLKTRIEHFYIKSPDSYVDPSSFPSIILIGNNDYCYPDMVITPKGTVSGNVQSEFDQTQTIDKDNFGYPSFLKVNRHGRVTQKYNLRWDYDDLGRITKEYSVDAESNQENDVVLYHYDNNNLVKISRHDEYFDFDKTFEYDKNGNIAMTIKKSTNSEEITTYRYDNDDVISEWNFSVSDDATRTIKITSYQRNNRNIEAVETIEYLANPAIDISLLKSNNNDETILDKDYMTFKERAEYKYEAGKVIHFKNKTYSSSIEYPNIKSDVEYIYNELNQLMSIKQPSGKTTHTYEYHSH